MCSVQCFITLQSNMIVLQDNNVEMILYESILNISV